MITVSGPVALADFLPGNAFVALQRNVAGLTGTERSYVPLHKRGGTIAYSRIRERAPALAEFYASGPHLQAVSRVLGLPVRPTPLRDESSLSVLLYERPGDHIGWHYDHNFYRGRHFAVLLAIENRGHGADGLSASRLFVRTCGREQIISTPANTLVAFEGARIMHRVTPILEAERRVVLSMTYCTDPRNSIIREAGRRIKDMAFFGPRALWT